MNIFEMENMVKGLPDEILQRELASPSDPGRFPQWLTMSEVMRRKSMRESFQAKNAPQGTVKDQVMQEGIAAAMPQGPQGGPPMGPPPGPQGAPVAAYGGGQMPYRMAGGGSVPQPGGNPQVFQQFMQRNFGTPQGLATNIGMVGGALLGGPLGSVLGANVGSYLGNRMSAPVQMSDWDRARLFAKPFNQGADLQEVPAEPPPFVDGMAGGGYIPGTVFMQEGRKVPSFDNLVSVPSFSGGSRQSLLALEEILKIPEQLRTPEQKEFLATITPQMEQFAVTPVAPEIPDMTLASEQVASVPPVAGAPPAAGATTAPAGTAAPAPTAIPNNAMSFLDYVPAVQSRVEAMMPKPVGFDVAGYTKAFKPQESDYLNPEFQKQRQAMVDNLRAEAQKRREADIALAQRYMSEAEAPIKKAEEEAKKAAIGAVLTRLGAGLMQGESAAGLASAAESAEKILGRQRELSAVERRAAKQEFRAAEREAIRGERGSADQAFNMEAQNLTSDENAQRQFVRDSKQFSQQVFGLLREAGRDQRQAHMESVRLTFSISQAIDTALREQKRESGLSERQYLQTFGNIYGKVFDALEDSPFIDPKTGEERAPTGEELIDLANKKTIETLKDTILSASPIKVTTQEEYNKLPSGTVFIDPQGMKRTKP